MAKSKGAEYVRLNFYMKKDFVEAIDAYADSIGVTRPAAISFMINQWMESKKNMDAIANLGEFASKSK